MDADSVKRQAKAHGLKAQTTVSFPLEGNTAAGWQLQKQRRLISHPLSFCSSVTPIGCETLGRLWASGYLNLCNGGQDYHNWERETECISVETEAGRLCSTGQSDGASVLTNWGFQSLGLSSTETRRQGPCLSWWSHFKGTDPGFLRKAFWGCKMDKKLEEDLGLRGADLKEFTIVSFLN